MPTVKSDELTARVERLERAFNSTGQSIHNFDDNDQAEAYQAQLDDEAQAEEKANAKVAAEAEKEQAAAEAAQAKADADAAKAAADAAKGA